MATLTVIASTEAPKPPKAKSPHSKRMRDFEDYLMQVKAGKVGVLIPEEGESSRGLMLRVGRAARRMNKTVNTWAVDGNVYFSHPISGSR